MHFRDFQQFRTPGSSTISRSSTIYDHIDVSAELKYSGEEKNNKQLSKTRQRTVTSVEIRRDPLFSTQNPTESDRYAQNWCFQAKGILSPEGELVKTTRLRERSS